MEERKRRSVLPSARADGDWKRRPLGYGSGEGGVEKGRRRRREACDACMFDFGWSLLETREAKQTWEEEIGSSY